MLYLVVAGLLASAPPDGDNPSPEVSTIVDRLRERHARLRSWTCLYRLESGPTSTFIADYATTRKIPEDQVRQQFGQRLECRIDETLKGPYRYEESRLDPEGRTEGRRILSHDGKQDWRVKAVPLDAEADSNTVEVNGRIGPDYLSAATYIDLLGDPVRPGSRPLYLRVSRGHHAERLPDESIDGASCVVLRWQEEVNGLTMRTTAWLDKAKGLVLRKYREEARHPERDVWVGTSSGTVREVASTRVKVEGGPSADYWYPRVVETVTSNEAGEKTFDARYTIRSLVLNPTLDAGHFTPRIEDGSKVRDVRTNKVTIYGGGPSPRLKKWVERRVRESKALIRESVQGPPPDPQVPPRHWSSHLIWVGLACGVVGLVTALTLRRRGG